MAISRRTLLAVAWLSILVACPAMAAEYRGAKVTGFARGRLQIQGDGYTRTVWVNTGAKIYNEDGSPIDFARRADFLDPGIVVNVTTKVDERGRREDATEIRIVSGKKASRPGPTTSRSDAGAGANQGKTRERIDLRPDPNFKGELRDFYPPKEWEAWLPTAKVGDFVEEGDWAHGFGRHEVVAVEDGAIVVAQTGVVIMGESRSNVVETRARFRIRAGAGKAPAGGEARKPAPPRDNKAGKPAPPAAADAPETETLTVAGRELKCQVKKDGKVTTWTCPEVPFDGKVKQVTANSTYTLVDFGRGR